MIIKKPDASFGSFEHLRSHWKWKRHVSCNAFSSIDWAWTVWFPGNHFRLPTQVSRNEISNIVHPATAGEANLLGISDLANFRLFNESYERSSSDVVLRALYQRPTDSKFIRPLHIQWDWRYVLQSNCCSGFKCSQSVVRTFEYIVFRRNADL